ncbi:trypsin-like peptidase domain-containing protein [Aquimarina agarilytica]|uniref:trypsin-like peptidase domain-containing protein n=1 Tax=Aquimarina agarilytica TaxID=1087449 RepID=UPI000288E696|nr:trypsin-like peptidase domain-containing protein [Aquimarina agarilytica]
MLNNRVLFVIVIFFNLLLDQGEIIAQNEDQNEVSLESDDAFIFGAVQKVNYNPVNSGTWELTSNGDRIWRFEVKRDGATSLNLVFDKLYIPKGGILTLSTPNQKEIITYTHKESPRLEKLGTWLLKGDQILLEYFEPKAIKGGTKINICQVVNGFKKLASTSSKAKAVRVDECDIDAMCDSDSEEINTLKERLIHSVVLINTGFSFCTGTLINNTRGDRKLYLLTANHCIGSTDPAFWSFRFNFFNDAQVCADPDFETFSEFQVINGAKILARNAKTDVALLELNGTVDPDWNLEWAGWNNKNEIPELSFGLHHPAGNPTKLAVDYHDLISEEIEFREEQTKVWTLDPDFGGWDLGITTQGSSGSALFNEKGEIIGQLLGGNARCLESFDNDRQDHYGRLTESWDISSNPAESLKTWLDPDNTNAETLGMLSKEKPFNSDSIKIFPNPIADKTLFLDQFIQGGFKIYNMQGVNLLQKEHIFFTSIDISSLAIGHYLIEFFDEKGQKAVKRFVKIN